MDEDYMDRSARMLGLVLICAGYFVAGVVAGVLGMLFFA
jgi:hypothetical protein